MGKKITKALECAKKIGMGFICIIAATVIYNPVVWLIWALVHPSSAAECLETATNRNEPAWWYVAMLKCFNFALAYLMPWRVRREVVKVTRVTLCCKDDLRGYEEEILEFSEVGAKASEILWKTSAEYREDACRKCLQENEFEEVLGDSELLQIYLKRTPSKDRIRRMLEVFFEENTSPEIKEIILNYVKFNGLPTDVVLEFINQGASSHIKDALEIFHEVDRVKNFENSVTLWEKWITSHGALSAEAESVMESWQLTPYLAQGYPLHEDVLLKWMKDKNGKQYVHEYVNELKKSGTMSEKVYFITITDKWWRNSL